MATPTVPRTRETLTALVRPNWFAAVMGTGIVAVAATTLPVHVPGLHVFAEGVWLIAAALLGALVILTVRQWLVHPSLARSHHLDPVLAHFYGAPPMAMLTVGAGALHLWPGGPALALDWVLWLAGTVSGLVCAVAIPYIQFTRHKVELADAFGGWLMPVVPPMVSAATGALLVPHLAAGQAQLTLLVCCYAMFGLSLLASLVVIVLVWLRLVLHGVGAPRTVPTLWIVLGPLGQSITAVNVLAATASGPYAHALKAFGVVYGVPVWGFALLWACLAGAMTVRTVRTGMPFAATWWSFTFPVGTCVTGTSALAMATGSVVFRYAAAVFYAGLVCAWLTVGVRAVRSR